MTLLDISKIKNKDAGTTTNAESKPQSSNPIPPKPEGTQTNKPANTPSNNTAQNQGTDLNNIKQAIAEGLSSVAVDKIAAGKKYEEIQSMYDKLTKEDKPKVYNECMNLFKALK